MIKTLDDLPKFFSFLIRNLKVLIFFVLCLCYFFVFRFLRYEKRDTGPTVPTSTDYEILKLVDIVEYVPPPKPVEPPPAPKPEEKIVQVEEQPVASEEIVEVEETVVEVPNEQPPVEVTENTAHNVGGHNVEEIEYLPQHKISKVPEIPAKEILSKIVYPPMAHRQGIEGVVYLELYIDADGTIKKAVVLKDPGHGFAEAALAALEGVKCVPAQSNGKNVPVRFRYPVKFTIK